MTYVISDIHGRYDRYTALLERIDLRDEDTLYVLGDVIDRGPDGCKILLDMMARPNVLPILGNHEFTAAMCLPWLLREVTSQNIAELSETQAAALGEWIINGGNTTLQELNRLSLEEREEILEYLQEMELYAEVEAGGRSFVLVHAGLDNFSPNKLLADYALPDFIFSRPRLDMDFYPDRYLVYGHTPTRVLHRWGGEPPADDVVFRGTQIAIDCRCGFDGGRLGCLNLDTLKVLYIE